MGSGDVAHDGSSHRRSRTSWRRLLAQPAIGGPRLAQSATASWPIPSSIRMAACWWRASTRDPIAARSCTSTVTALDEFRVAEGTSAIRRPFSMMGRGASSRRFRNGRRPIHIRLNGDGCGAPAELRIGGRPRLLDPTPFVHEGTSISSPIWPRRDLGAPAVDGGKSRRVNLPSIRASPDPPVAAGIPDGGRHRPDRRRPVPRRPGPSGGPMATACPSSGSAISIGSAMGGMDPGFPLRPLQGPHTLNLNDGRAAFDFYVRSFLPWPAFAG